MRKVLGFFMTAVLTIVSLSGCQLEEQGEQNKEYRVAAILPENNKIRATDFWKQVWSGVHDGAEIFNIALSEYSSDESNNIQERFEMAVAAQGDGILLFTSDTGNQNLLDGIEDARKTGRKIVVVDTDIGTSYYDAFIGIDNESAGSKLAAYLYTHYQSGEKILALNVNASGAVDKRKESFFDFLEEKELENSAVLVSLKEGNEERLQGIQEAIEENEKVKWIVSFDPSCTIQAAETLLRMELSSEISLIGFGESDSAEAYLEDGIIRALLVQDNYNMGLVAVEKMRQLLDGEKLEKKQYYVDFMLLSADEISEGKTE